MYLHSIELLARGSTGKEPAYQKNLTFSSMCGIINDTDPNAMRDATISNPTIAYEPLCHRV